MVAYPLAKSRPELGAAPVSDAYDNALTQEAPGLTSSPSRAAYDFPVASRAEQGYVENEIQVIDYGEFLKGDESGRQVLRGARTRALKRAQAAVEDYNSLDPAHDFHFALDPIVVGKTEGFPPPSGAWKSKLGVHQMQIQVEGKFIKSLMRFVVMMSIDAQPIPGDPESPPFKQRGTFDDFLALILVPDAIQSIPAGVDASRVG